MPKDVVERERLTDAYWNNMVDRWGHTNGASTELSNLLRAPDGAIAPEAVPLPEVDETGSISGVSNEPILRPGQARFENNPVEDTREFAAEDDTHSAQRPSAEKPPPGKGSLREPAAQEPAAQEPPNDIASPDELPLNDPELYEDAPPRSDPEGGPSNSGDGNGGESGQNPSGPGRELSDQEWPAQAGHESEGSQDSFGEGPSGT